MGNCQFSIFETSGLAEIRRREYAERKKERTQERNLKGHYYVRGGLGWGSLHNSPRRAVWMLKDAGQRVSTARREQGSS